jgi:hypothetical protein
MKKLSSIILLFCLLNSSYAQIYVIGREYSDYDTTISGNYYSNVKFWKNEVPHTLFHVDAEAFGTDIFVDDTNIYIIGVVMDTNYLSFNRYHGFLWHNGTMQYLTDSTQWSTANSIVVVNGDIYIAGSIKNCCSFQNPNTATFWKNGVAQYLAQDERDTLYSSARSVFVEDSNVYVAGNITHYTSQMRSCGLGVVWKNGEELFTVGDGVTYSCFVYDMYVANGDVYLAGYEQPERFSGVSRAVIWKNGVPRYLTEGYSADGPYAYAIYVKDSNIYAAGTSYFYEWGMSATVWKNGVPQPYTTGGGPGVAADIAAIDNDIYVLTVQNNSVYVWKSDVWVYEFYPEDLPYITTSALFIQPDSLPNIGISPLPYAEKHIKFYPNPATDIITVELPANITQASLQLFDLQGRLIKQETIHHKSVLNVAGLHPGLYLYKVVAENQDYNGKLLIIK